MTKLSRSQSCISSASISEAHLITAQAASSFSQLCPNTYFKRVGHDCAACRLQVHVGTCSYLFNDLKLTTLTNHTHAPSVALTLKFRVQQTRTHRTTTKSREPERELTKPAFLCGRTLIKSSSPPPALTTANGQFPGKCARVEAQKLQEGFGESSGRHGDVGDSHGWFTSGIATSGGPKHIHAYAPANQCPSHGCPSFSAILAITSSVG